MRYVKPLLILIFLTANLTVFSAPKKVLLAANESVIGKPAVIIENAAESFSAPPIFVVSSKLFIKEGNTVNCALKTAKELGMDYVLTFDFTNELPDLLVTIRLAQVEQVDVLKTFHLKTTPDNVIDAVSKFAEGRIKTFLEKHITTPARTTILGEISLISESGILYLTMENNLLPPIGSIAEVNDNFMKKIGEIQVTDIADDYCIAVVLQKEDDKIFEKGNIVKVTLGNNGTLTLSSHDEKYLICSECNGTGSNFCSECNQGDRKSVV